MSIKWFVYYLPWSSSWEYARVFSRHLDTDCKACIRSIESVRRYSWLPVTCFATEKYRPFLEYEVDSFVVIPQWESLQYTLRNLPYKRNLLLSPYTSIHDSKVSDIFDSLRRFDMCGGQIMSIDSPYVDTFPTLLPQIHPWVLGIQKNTHTSNIDLSKWLDMACTMNPNIDFYFLRPEFHWQKKDIVENHTSPFKNTVIRFF